MHPKPSNRRVLLRSNRSLVIGLGVVLVIVVLLVTLPPATTFWTTRLRDQLSGQITEFEDLRLQIENDVEGMQAAQRGYLITRQQAFLESYQTRAAKLPAHLEQLSRLAPLVDPLLATEVQELQQRINRWQQEGPELQLDMIRQDDLAGAVANVSTGQSQQHFDAALEQLRLLSSEINRIEAGLTARISSVRRFETVLAASLGLLGIVLGGYLVRVFQRVAGMAVMIEHERERAEQAMIEANRAHQDLQREQQRLQAVFNQSPEGLLLLEADTGAVVLANQAARTLLDDPLNGEPLLPTMLERCFQPTGEKYTNEQLPLQRALRGEMAIGVEVLVEQRGGHRVPLLFNCAPLRSSEGEVQGAVAVFQDLTRFREVERLKADFVALVSHELRTPLTAIQGCTQSLLHGTNGADPGRAQEFLEIIDAQSTRLHELIDNLLDVSQIEAGSLRLRTGPVQPTRLVRGVVRQVSERVPGLIVQADVPQPVPTISADADRIEQVLLNLLDNARKFAPAQSVITVRVVSRPDDILFSVRDQGPGIAASDREHIFERFYQGAPPSDGATRGTGLGLAICKSLVEAHGGHIWVDEHVTKGTQINFTLPRVLVAETVAEDAPLTTAIRPAHEAAHVLIVDDEPAIRQMLMGSLRNAGYVVSAVSEGQAALEQIATEPPDLVVLDVMLPGQDGFAILQQIRDWSDVLVLMLTASPEPGNVVRGLQIGADDYLTKPFSMDELLARIAALLRRRAHALVPETTPIFQSGPLTIDFARRIVQINGHSVELTPTEFRLLAVLAQHVGRVLTHAQLLQQVWGPEYGGENQYLWVHIGRLRQKIESDPKAPQLIVTERGVGYRLVGDQPIMTRGVA